MSGLYTQFAKFEAREYYYRMSILERFKKQRSPEEEAEFRTAVDVSRGYCKRDAASRERQRQFHLDAVKKERGLIPDTGSLADSIHGTNSSPKPQKQGWFYKSNQNSTGNFMATGTSSLPKPTATDYMGAYMEVLEEIKNEEMRAKGMSPDEKPQPEFRGVYSPPPPKLAGSLDVENPNPLAAMFVTIGEEGYPTYRTEEPKFRKLNRILAVDRWKSVYKVEAKNSYGIKPGTDYFLGGSIIQKEKGIFYVSFGWDTQDFTKFKMYPASGSIVPIRTDEMQGLDLAQNQIPVKLDWEKIPDDAFENMDTEMKNNWGLVTESSEA